MSQIKDPNKVALPTMGVTPDELVREFLNLDKQLSECQRIIEMAQNTIVEQKQNGQILIGKLDILARMLNGMGIDPRKWTPPQEKSPVETPEIPAKTPENEGQVVEIKGDAAKKAIAARFNK